MEGLDLYHPVTWGGERVRLHYARPADLANFRRLVAIRGEVLVQGWGESGEALAELPLDAKVARKEIPKELRGLVVLVDVIGRWSDDKRVVGQFG